MRLGMSVAEIHEVTHIDPWFLERVAEIVALEDKVRALRPARRRRQSAPAQGGRLLRRAPRRRWPGSTEADVAKARAALGVAPVYKRIDTCAAEFASPTAYMYSTYETPFAGALACEARPIGARQDRHPRRRAEPHRPGHRVRLLLLPRLVRAARGGLRDDHDQLQSGDGVDRLRHFGSPLFRAADRRGRARHPRQGARGGDAEGRHRPVRRPDAAQARPRDRAVGRADPRHLGQFDRPRRGPRPLQAAARQARPQAAEERHRLFGRAVAPRRRRPRPAAGGASVLRARRPRDGDHPRRGRIRRLSARRAAEPGAGRRQGALSQRQDRPDQHGAGQEPAAVRPLSLRRDRDRRRRAVRRQGRRRRRDHGAYRGGGHPFRRQRLLAAAALALRPRRSPGSRTRRASSRWRSTSAA